MQQSIDLWLAIKNPLEAIEKMGAWIAKSGFFDCTRIEQGMVIAMHCLAKRMSPVELMEIYDLIDGKLRKKALACLAEFRKKGGKHVWLETGDDGPRAIGQFTFEGNTYKVAFKMEDAERQGLIRPNSNWVKTPGNMLRARVITNAIGMLAPEIIAGGPEDIEPPFESAPSISSGQGIEGTVVAIAPPTELVLAPPSKEPPVAIRQEEEQTESEMGLAPVQKPKTGPIKSLDPIVEPEPDDPGPIPPVKNLDPQVDAVPEIMSREAQVVRRPNPLIPPDQLSVEDQLEMVKIFKDHYLEVANWMIKENWIQVPPVPLKTEQEAIDHLDQNLRFLTRSRARRILNRKMAFMRSIEELKP